MTNSIYSIIFLKKNIFQCCNYSAKMSQLQSLNVATGKCQCYITLFLHIVVLIGCCMKHCVMLRREFSITGLDDEVIFTYIFITFQAVTLKYYNSLYSML